MLELLLRRRGFIWSIFGLSLALCSLGLIQLEITPDNRVLYGASDPRFIELQEFENEFRSNTSIAFVITCKEQIYACPQLATAIRDLTSGLNTLANTIHVDSLATYPYVASSDEAILTMPFLDHMCPTACDVRTKAHIEQEHIVGRLISQDLTTASVIAAIDLDITDQHAVDRIYEQASALLSSVDSDLDVRFVGTVPMMKAFVDATNQELTGVMGLAMLLLIATLYFTLGSLLLTSTVVGLGLATISITLGLAGWTGLILNTATATIPLILFTLTLATSMHMFMHIVRAITNDSRTAVSHALSAALETQRKPILMTSATTIVCMLSLLAVSSPPIQEIGLWTAIGVTIGTLILLFVVPLVVVSFQKLPKSKWQSLLQPLLNRYARNIERNSIATTILLIALAISALSILNLEVDDDFVRYFSETNSFRADSEYAAEKILGPNNIELVITSPSKEGVFDPNYLEFVERIVQRLRQHADVENVFSLLDVLKPINENFGTGVGLFSLTRDQIAQLFLAYELSLEYGQSSSDLINVDRTSSRVSILAGDVSSAKIRSLDNYIRELATESKSSFSIRVTGESIPISYLSPRNIQAMSISILSTFLVTSLILGLYFRQWRIALISFISTVIPVICGFGLWGVFVDSVGLSTTVIVAVCMGVVIDDSIHMIFRHRYALEDIRLGNREAVAYSIHRVGTAIVTTTIVLAVGFSVMLFSEFRLNSTFGGCSALIILFALLFDLRILPGMLMWAADADLHNKNNKVCQTK